MQVPTMVARYLRIEAKKKTCYTILETHSITGSGLDKIGGVAMEDLSRVKLAFPLTTLYVFAFVGILSALTWIGTQQQLSSPYLSLIMDPSAICDEVPQPVSGTFQGSYDGYWETNPQKFNPAKSLFVLEFLGSSVSNAEFKQIMAQFAAELSILGEKAKLRNSAFAALMYASYTLVYTGSNMRFYSSSDARDIFFNQLLTTTVSSRSGTCDSYKSTKRYVGGEYDWARASMVARVPFVANETYIGNSLKKSLLKNYTETCPEVLHLYNPNSIMSDPGLAMNKGSTSAEYSFDINAMIAVLTVNLGFNSVSGMVKINSEVRVGYNNAYSQKWYGPIKDYDKLVAYMDPNSFSPDKTPIYCYDKTKLTWLTPAQVAGPDICFLATHDAGQNIVQLYYPVLSQMSNNPLKSDQYGNIKMEACTCPSKATSAYCNYQDVIWGLIFDQGNSTSPGRLHDIALAAQSFIINDSENGDISFSAYFEDMLGYTANVDYGRKTADQLIQFDWSKDPSGSFRSYKQLLQAGWDKICPWKTCSAFVFESYADDTTYPYIGLNKYHVQLADLSNEVPFQDSNYLTNPAAFHKQQMCTDTLSQATAMDMLGSKPPITLTQKYYQCRPTLRYAAINAVGSAAGSAGLAVQIGTILVGSLVVFGTNLVLRLLGRENESLIKASERRDINATYSALKDEAVTEMFKASSETVMALRALVKKQQKMFEDQIMALGNRIERIELMGVAENLPGFNYLAEGGRTIGGGALDVFNRIEEAVEGEIHELERVVAFGRGGATGNSEDPDSPSYSNGGGDGGSSVGSPSTRDPEAQEERRVTMAIKASNEEKKREHLEKLSRSEDDIDYFEALMKKKLNRVKLLFNIEDIVNAAEEHRIRAGKPAGAANLESDLEAMSTARALAERNEAAAAKLANEESLIGQVGYGLSYLNPFSYVPMDLGLGGQQQQYPGSRAQGQGSGVELTAAQRAAKQLEGLPKINSQYYLPTQFTDHGATVLSYSDYASAAAPVVSNDLCLGNQPPVAPPRRADFNDDNHPHRHLGDGEQGWESSSSSSNGGGSSSSSGDGDVGAWRSQPHTPPRPI